MALATPDNSRREYEHSSAISNASSLGRSEVQLGAELDDAPRVRGIDDPED
jgi:hypothetical protein